MAVVATYHSGLGVGEEQDTVPALVAAQTIAALAALKKGDVKTFSKLVVLTLGEGLWLSFKALTNGFNALDSVQMGPYEASIFITLLAAGAWNHKISDAPDGWKSTEQAMDDVRARLQSIGCPLPDVVPQKNNAYFDTWVDGRDGDFTPAGMGATYSCLLQKLTGLARAEGSSVYAPTNHYPLPFRWINRQPLLAEEPAGQASPAVTVAFLALLGKPGSPTSIPDIAAAPPVLYTGVTMIHASKYPTGSIGKLNTKTNRWSIYAPSDALASAAAPAGYVKVGEEASLPAGVKDAGTEHDPFYQQPVFWAVSAGAVAVIVGGVVVWRRRR